MFFPLRTALSDTLSLHFALSKSRIATMAILIIGLVNSRTVNLSHLASQFPGEALHASNYRRLQRFFQYVRLDQADVAQIVKRMINLNRPVVLALDRTNWQVGSKQLNILMLAIVTRRFRVPLLWMIMDHRGNSNTLQRITLLQRYLDLFGASSIKILLADREFIGAQWMDFLNQNNVPFAIRVKSQMRVSLKDGSTWSLKTLTRRKRARTTIHTWAGWLQGLQTTPQTSLSFAAKQLANAEWLIVATNLSDPKEALRTYRKRWGIECLFADTKTRGFNLEDTHMSNLDKISTMLALLTLAIVWSYRCATQQMGLRAIKRKAHGRREKSWFRTGFDILRRWIIHKPENAIAAWTKTYPKKLKICFN